MSQKNIDDIYPLSPMQRMMLTYSASANDPVAVNHQFKYHITGDLDVTRFFDAWSQLIARHSALRTAFLWEGLEVPVQVVRGQVKPNFQYSDLRKTAVDQQSDVLQTQIDADRALGIDIRRAPLFRLHILQTADDEFTMLWTRQHLILDRWCVDILFSELFDLYQSHPNPAPLHPAGQFGDYIDWLSRQDTNLATRYWSRELKGVSQPSLLFPSVSTSGRDADQQLPFIANTIEQSLFASLNELARLHRVSLATILQGAIALLLHKVTAHETPVFGITVAGRPAELMDVDTALGSFINNVPVSINVDKDQPLAHWFTTIQAKTAERQPFEYLSLADIQRASDLPANRPMFDVLSLLHSPATEALSGPGFRIEQIETPWNSVYPLTLSLAETKGELQIIAAYMPHCIAENEVAVLLQLLLSILKQFAEHPTGTVADVFAKIEMENTPIFSRSVGLEKNLAQRASLRPALQKLTGVAGDIAEIWNRVLGLEDIRADDDFFALGGTSVQAAIMFAELENLLGRQLPLSLLFKASSIRTLLLELDEELPPTSTLVEIQPGGSQAPLFVVPGVGGNVVGLEGLARAFGSDQPFFGLQSPGVDGQLQPLGSIEDIVVEYLKDIPDLEAGSYSVFGICWGAVSAFELVRQLSARKIPPGRLILMDPVFQSDENFVDQTPPHPGRMKFNFVVERLRSWWSDFRGLGRGRRLPWLKEKLNLILIKLSKRDLFHGLHGTLDQELVTQTNLSAAANYRPQLIDDVPTLLILTNRQTIGAEGDARDLSRAFLPEDTAVIHLEATDTGQAIIGPNAVSLAEQIKPFLPFRGDVLSSGHSR